MTKIAVLIPVLNRPHRVDPLLASLAASQTTIELVPIFLCSSGDEAEIAAIREQAARHVIVPWEAGDGDYARKLNLGYTVAREDFPWVFLAADDLEFRRDWAESALRWHDTTGACVIGTNDLGNSRVIAGHHSTHSLVHADYHQCGTIDEDDRILHESYSHEFCNPPEAPIWMADCTFKPLGEIGVGDVIVGWTRIEAEAARVGTPRRSLCYSEVLNVGRRTSPLVRVVMESGREFRCTPDHHWLNAAWAPTSSHNAQFVVPRVGRTLLHVVDQPDPVPPHLVRAAGWLAGMYDGEGSGIVAASQSSTCNPEIVEALRIELDRLDVDYSWTIRPGGQADFVLNGGRQGYLDFLLRIDPVRRASLAAHILGWRNRYSSRTEREPIGARRFGHRDRIVAVEPVPGESEVVSLTTSSGNYIAWGYASRNCDDELVQTAIYRGTFVFARDAIVEHMHPDWQKGEWDATYEKGRRYRSEDRALYLSRRHLWGK